MGRTMQSKTPIARMKGWKVEVEIEELSVIMVAHNESSSSNETDISRPKGQHCPFGDRFIEVGAVYEEHQCDMQSYATFTLISRLWK